MASNSSRSHSRKSVKRATTASDEELAIDDIEQGGTKKLKVRWESQGPTDEETEESAEDDEGTKDSVCLVATCVHGRVGCAYYDPIKCVVYVLEDTEETGHFDLMKMVLDHAVPDVVLTSSRADDSFIDALKEYMDDQSGLFQIRPHKEFSPIKGRERLLGLSLLADLPQTTSSSDRDNGSDEPLDAYSFMRRRRQDAGDPVQRRWNASVRLANYAALESAPLCLSSAGALLDHMVRARAVSDLEDAGVDGLQVRAIEELALNKVMQINADALYSLQIFENEGHASVHSDKTKEGLSLFGILNNTKTTLGRALLRTWLLRPSLSLHTIRTRHDAVECLLRPENVVTASAMHGHLNGIKNVPRVLTAMRTGRARLPEWQALVRFTFHSAMLRDALTELHHAAGIEVAERLIAVLDISSFREVGNAANDVIDWEESVNCGRICVRPHIDEDLDNRKHVYHGIDSVLSKVAEQISQTVPPDYATSLNVVYFPQLGFLVCMPLLEEWTTEDGIQVLDGWSFQFSSETHVYFKSQEMHDMDTHIGDLHSAIVDRELEIVQSLQEKILQFEEPMSRTCDVCAELDCLLSFAEASNAYGYRRPIMVEDNVIRFTLGRHPLHEQLVDAFVPNDAYLVGGAGSGFSTDTDSIDGTDQEQSPTSIVICTGANACGKSVYLKQVAMIQYMAQIGCFVPAEEAELGIVDKIFTRIQTRESVSRIQSSFMNDLNQVSLALRNCTSRSLVLLDEFGKGTMPPDGAGLFCGVVQSLLNRGDDCPKVLAATHFHEIFRNGLFYPGPSQVSFVHMQVMFTDDSGQAINESGSDEDAVVGPGETITYLYRVARGLASESHAAKCAEIFGVPKRVVERARYVTSVLTKNELHKLLDEDMTAKEQQELEEGEAVCRGFLTWNFQSENHGLENGLNVKAKLAEVLGREMENEDED